MEIALIGLPQSGKATLLNALTRGRAEVGAYGGARQEVHAGVTSMADPRLDALAGIFKPDKLVPVEIKYWDVPASFGGDDAGIGGQFLNLFQGSDALLQVVRAFEDPSVAHARGSVNPERDAQELETELALSDLTILERRIERIDTNLKGSKGHDRDVLLREASLIGRLKEDLEAGTPIREQQLSGEELDQLSNYQLLTSKPLLTVLNIGEGDISSAAEVEGKMPGSREGRPGIGTATLCAKLEQELAQLDPDEEFEFRESLGLRESGLDKVVRLSYQLLSLISFFTYVSKEVRAWSVLADTPASRAAGRIHSDMERGFIRAEVVPFDDLVQCGSVAQCKKQGLVRLEGKTYPVKDGDVITFLFNV